MSNPFSRPLFRTNFLRHYAEGGIVSNVVGPEDPGQLDPVQVLHGMAQQVDTTEKNLDNASGIDEILSSFTGTQKTAADARKELADLVGKRDAEKTPDSVLALVQPAMAIMEMSRQMQPQGGIQQAPFNGQQEAAPAGFTGAVPAFAEGGDVDVNALIAKYAALQGQIPASYGRDPSSAWLALAQFGAGLAQGPTFAQGMSKGTAMAGPYMANAIEGMNARRSALTAFVANEASNQESQNRQFAHQDKLQQEQIAAQQKLAQTQFTNDLKLRQWDFQHPQVGATQRMTDDLSSMYGQLGSLPPDDPQRAVLQKKIDAYENVLFPADRNDPLLKYKLVTAANGGDPSNPVDVGKTIQSMEPSNNETSDTKNARRITELKKILAADPTNTDAKVELDTLTELTKNKGVSVTNNIGEKGAIAVRAAFADRKDKVYTPEQISRAKQLNSIEVLKTILSIDPSQGGPYMGLGAEQFAKVGQVLESIGYTGDIPSFFRGPALSQAFQTAAADLSVEQQKDMARGTNLTLQIIQQATANVGKNPDANKLWVDMNEKVLRWQAKNDDYLSLLEQTYGADNPAILKATDPEDPTVQGLELPRKPLSKLTESEIFDKQGRPLLSYSDYVAWRQMHEPAVDEKLRQQIIGVARTPTNNGYPVPDISGIHMPGSGPSATPPRPATMRDFNATPGVSVDVTRPGQTAAPAQPQTRDAIKVDGVEDVFVRDPKTGYYVGKVTGKIYDIVTQQFVTAGGR